MNVLSLFSGVGGIDLGFETAGHHTIGFCEIDPKCREILAHHWPGVPIHEDVTTLNPEEYRGRVDLVAGGSPCQDLSVAGRRKGLDGERSGLFWHQCRIADQSHARWFLWENVAGALTSNNGADFAAVLWGITGTHPAVPDEGWRSCGVVVGPKRTAVWRVFDARWFGVPQRRRRVFIVAGPRTECGPEILFEPSSSPRDSAPSGQTEQEVAGTLGGGTLGGGPRPDTDRMTFIPTPINTVHGDTDFSPSLDTRSWQGPRRNQESLAVIEPFRGDNINGWHHGVGPLRAWGGDLGGGWETLLASNAMPDLTPMAFSENQRADVVETSYVRSITSGGGKPGQGYPAVLAPTLTAANNPSRSPQSTEITSQVEAIQQATSAVRRLTPLECERLMAWPDNWTAEGVNGPIADSHRYRMCGNGVVSNIT